jgi:hypothetical protein
MSSYDQLMKLAAAGPIPSEQMSASALLVIAEELHFLRELLAQEYADAAAVKAETQRRQEAHLRSMGRYGLGEE